MSNFTKDSLLKQSVENFKLIFLYINKDKELVYTKKNTTHTLSKDELLTILKKNILLKEINYIPSHIFQFNIDLDPENILYYITYPEKFNFFRKVTYLQDIDWRDSIPHLSSLNTLYIFMKEQQKNFNTKTKKIFLHKKKKKKTRRIYH